MHEAFPWTVSTLTCFPPLSLMTPPPLPPTTPFHPVLVYRTSLERVRVCQGCQPIVDGGIHHSPLQRHSCADAPVPPVLPRGRSHGARGSDLLSLPAVPSRALLVSPLSLHSLVSYFLFPFAPPVSSGNPHRHAQLQRVCAQLAAFVHHAPPALCVPGMLHHPGEHAGRAAGAGPRADVDAPHRL